MGLTEQEQKFWDTLCDPNPGKTNPLEEWYIDIYIKPARPVEWINLPCRIHTIGFTNEKLTD